MQIHIPSCHRNFRIGGRLLTFMPFFWGRPWCRVAKHQPATWIQFLVDWWSLSHLSFPPCIPLGPCHWFETNLVDWYGCHPQNRGGKPPKWMVNIMVPNPIVSLLFKWMIWGYHYFWKHPYVTMLSPATQPWPWPLFKSTRSLALQPRRKTH